MEQELHKVQILDPATGTGTFLAEVVKRIHQNFQGQQGIWSNYVENHLLPRLNGFELLMASYAMAHLKLDLLLSETGFQPKSNQRFKVYLTNSLEEHHPDTGTLFANWLSTEANEANHIKRDTPVMCVVGNPPYSGESANKGEWIMSLMEDYKKEPGGKEKLKERNPKWINDDYVKFLRYGQYFIEKNGSGVLAFINPHGYLDNPTFRGMRWNLLKTFDKIYTIDLHGNSKKKETAPDGSADINVFDIQQGVSINIFVKTGKKKPNELGKILHFDLYGKRDFKYDFLNENSLQSIAFNELPNIAPDYYFVSKNFEMQSSYDKGISLNDLFPYNSVGIVTSRDKLVIDSRKDNLIAKVKSFFENDIDYITKILKVKENSTFKIRNVKEKSNFSSSHIKKISYRPFDEQYIYFDPDNFIERSRGNLISHFENTNQTLIFRRQQPSSKDLYIFTSKSVIADGYIRSDNKGGESVAPLYLYSETNGQHTIEQSKDRKPNLNAEIVKQIADKLGLTFTDEKESNENTFAPIDILDYIYAVLHSPNYREKYKEFLKIDFPRVPYPKDKKAFWQLVKLGREIRQIHLLASPAVEQYITQYPEDGNNVVGKPRYKEGKVFINNTQYFDNVPEIAWGFYIGGYQPAQKWLKDRTGRTLEFDDILHYQKIIVALSETDRLMKEIDEIEFE